MTDHIINNRYAVIRVLGKGGMGTVYCAEDRLHNNQLVAVKEIHEKAFNIGSLTIFKKEFDIMSRLRHPNLVKVYDFGKDVLQQSYFLTMEYIQGMTLDTYVEQNKPLSQEKAVDIIIQLCRALEFIHSRDILHRDIKPSNILIDQQIVKITDFGLSDLDVSDSKVKGTLQYMAPELFQGVVDKRSDIYSLGITAYELLANMSYFENVMTQSIIEILQIRNQFQAQKTKTLSAIADRSLQQIVDRMSAFEPSNRYSSCSEIIEAINTGLGLKYEIETSDTKDAYVVGSGFVGRKEQLHLLEHHLNTPVFHALFLLGEPGVGKSRLMNEFKKLCQLTDILFLEANCNELASRMFDVFLKIVHSALLLANTELQKKYGPELKKLLVDLEVLQSVEMNPVHEPSTEKMILIKSITDFVLEFGRTYEQKVVIYLNDIHWIDESSLEVLKSLLKKYSSETAKKTKKNLLFIVSARPKEFKKYTDFFKDITFVRIELQPFQNADVSHYIQSLFHKNLLGKKLRSSIEQITVRTGGNPFHLQAFIKNLIHMQLLQRCTQVWDLIDDIGMLSVPDAIEELLLQRLTQFPELQNNRALQILALLDREIAWEELNALQPCSYELIQHCEDKEIVKERFDGSRMVYRLSHALLQKAFIDKIENKQELHLQIAQKIEELHSHELDKHIEELSYHYYQSGDRLKSRVYLEQQSIKECMHYSNNKALETMNILESLVTSDYTPQYIELLLRRGGVYRLTFNIQESKKDFLKAAQLSETLGNNRLLARVYENLGCLYLSTNEIVEAVEIFEKGIQICEKHGYKFELLHLLNDLGNCFMKLFNTTKAVEYYKKALVVAEEIGDKRGIAFAMGNLSTYNYEMGEYELAIEQNIKVNDILAEFGDKQNVAYGYSELGNLYFQRKKYYEALHSFDQALLIAQEIEFVSIIPYLHVSKARALFQLNSIQQAKNLLSQVEPLCNDSNSKIESMVLRAQIEAFENNPGYAIELLETFLSKMEKTTINIAYLSYQMWKIDGSEIHRKNALEYYQKLYLQSGYVRFKETVEELSFSNTTRETLCASIKSQMHTIEEMMQANTLDIQTKLLDTNSLLLKSINELEKKVTYFERFLDNQPVESLEEDKKKLLFFKDLLSIIHDLNSDYSLDVLLEKILDASISLMNAERGAILLFNKDNTLVPQKIRSSRRESLPLDGCKFSDTVIQQVIEKEQAIFVTNVVDNSNLSQVESIVELGLRSVMCTLLCRKNEQYLLERRKYPFLTAAQRVGVIYLDSKENKVNTNFSNKNLDFFQALADQASIALLNTILYENINIDQLTGLYLRSFFEQFLESEVRYCNEIKSQLSVLMVDVDFFKTINDRQGHQVGDKALKELANLLRLTLRMTDICGRYGGEEFILILPNTDPEQALATARKINEKVRNTVFSFGSMSVSIGISSFPLHCSEYTINETSKLLVKYADQALYKAKNDGRDRCELWQNADSRNQKSQISITDILTGNSIRDYKNVQMLLEVIQVMNSNSELPQIMWRISELILNNLEADKALILLHDDENNDFRIQTSLRDHDSGHAIFNYSYSKEIVSKVFKNGESICSYTIDSNLMSVSMAEMNILSVMCVPIETELVRFGVIYMDSQKVVKEFTKVELSFLKAVAALVSTIVSKNRSVSSYFAEQ